MGLLENKTALITGCGRGIGKALAERFAEEGADVYAVARAESSLADLADHAREGQFGNIIPVYFDIRDKAEIKKCIMRIKKEKGTLDVLVNNAGIMKDALVEMVDDNVMKETFDTNVFALVHMTQMAIKIMKNHGGSIINLSSIVGVRGSSGQTVYAASKGAVANLTMTWARELAGSNIRVNALAPGKIDTDMFRSIGRERVEKGIEEIGLGRLGTPIEVANVAVFLASELASYVTGEIIGVHGGWFL